MHAHGQGLISCLAAIVALAFASCERLAHAEAPEERPTFHLDYQLLDEESRNTCPREATVENLFARVFGYQVIDPGAGPGFAIDIAYSSAFKGFEVVGHILRDDKYALGTEMDRSTKASADACFHAVYGLTIGLASAKDELKNRLRAPQGQTSASEKTFGDAFVLRAEMAKRSLEANPPASLPSLPPPQLAAMPTSWRVPEGFILSGGLTFSVALLPTPSAGGIVGVGYRKGSWSGAIELRLDRGMVPAYLRNAPIEGLYAGTVLAVPVAHQGPFFAGLVTELGGYSFSTDQSLTISGRLFLLSIGLRTSIDLRVAEHFIVRGFAQASAIAIPPALILSGSEAWNSGPAFGTAGLSIVTVP